MPPMALTGIVTKAGFMNKTATVTVSRFVVHKTTRKRIVRSKKYLIHDEHNRLRVEDEVRIRNCPPISARKRFKLEKVLFSPEGERDAAHALQAEEALKAATAAPSLTMGESTSIPPLSPEQIEARV